MSDQLRVELTRRICDLTADRDAARRERDELLNDRNAGMGMLEDVLGVPERTKDLHDLAEMAAAEIRRLRGKPCPTRGEE